MSGELNIQKLHKGAWFNSGRWKRPTLSLVFWTRWIQTPVYRLLKFPKLKGDRIYLDGYSLFWKEDYDTLIALSQRAIRKKDPTIFRSFEKASRLVLKNHQFVAEKLARTGRYEKGLLEEFFDSWYNLCTPWSVVFPISRPLEDTLRALAVKCNESEKDIAEAIAPSRQTLIMQQNSEAADLARACRKVLGPDFYQLSVDEVLKKIRAKNPKLSQRIGLHLKRFEWIGTHHYWGEPLGSRRLFKQMREIEPERARKRILQFGPEMKWVLSLLKNIAFYRQSFAEVSDMAAFRARGLLKGTAKQIGLTYEQIVWLTDKEILDGLKGGGCPSTQEILQRQRAVGIIKIGAITKVITERELQRVTVKMMEKPKRCTELKGIPASPGFVLGRAFVAFTSHELNKMKNGEILIAPQTTPDFVPAMSKALAIVTDEGGLTCHAAIVSRELKKPCVVGTHNATVSFKTGDVVEVDADKGVVKILNKGA